MTRRHALAAAATVTVSAATTSAMSPPASDAATTRLLDEFAAAWNRHDLDGLMACMAPDCVFEASSGRDVTGTRSVGPAAVRAAYAAIFVAYPDARWHHPRHVVSGDRAVTEWTFTGTTADGTAVEVNGCDIFTLRGGKIALKNSYRKQRTP